jgi:ABC-2 type transport system ATP-binding protein
LNETPDHIDAPMFNVVSQTGTNLVVKINDGFGPNDVLRYFLQFNTSIISFFEILPSMNDVFIKLVEGVPSARQFEKLKS